MRTTLKIIAGIFVAVLLAVVACFFYFQVRGGFYPSYAAAGFSNLSAPDAPGHAADDPVARTDAGALRGRLRGIGDRRWRDLNTTQFSPAPEQSLR